MIDDGVRPEFDFRKCQFCGHQCFRGYDRWIIGYCLEWMRAINRRTLKDLMETKEPELFSHGFPNVVGKEIHEYCKAPRCSNV